MKLTFDNSTLDLKPNGKSYIAALDDRTATVEVLRAENGKLDLLIDGKRVTAYVSSDHTNRWVTVDGRTFMLTKSSGTTSYSKGKRRGAAGDQASGLTAPMPGLVRNVNVVEGESVTKGQTLMVLEAMKMEIRIHAPMDGVVKSLAVKVGQTVEREQELINVESQTSKV